MAPDLFFLLGGGTLFAEFAAGRDPIKLTQFSWDRVPVCAHFGKRQAPLTAAELDFLVAANPRCFFTYSWGYHEDYGMIEADEEFLKPLGPPKGPARWTGYHATQEFAHASVEVGLETRTGRVE